VFIAVIGVETGGRSPNPPTLILDTRYARCHKQIIAMIRTFVCRSCLLCAGLLLAAVRPCLAETNFPPHVIAVGPFKPTWESLEQGYQCPEWFRDAKFGIWAHWSAQCVPEQGDWYARNMYIQGTAQYNYQIAHYGHPSKFGFMEIDNLWHAEHWDPDKLMDLYAAAGAKYFVSLANHHDNFDNYDSKYHAWNSVNVGPHKDIVGTWAKVARAHGLRFGVSNHSSHAWHWFQVAYGYDATGPLAGVRYDAFTLTKADGKGKWWDGLDPQELYVGPSIVIPDGFTNVAAMHAWHDSHDGHWYETGPTNNPAFAENWFLRSQDLVDKYHPDLVYFDDTGLPLGQAGLDIAAHYYNANRAWHNGNLEAVIDVKQLDAKRRPAVVEDYERGASSIIQPAPWQTDTCIGDWHYNRARFEQHSYKTVRQVVAMLVNVVSKNGNLLLSVPVRGDGTIDDDEIAFLHGMADWMKVNGEGIFNSRPWKIFGEGPTHARGGMFSEAPLNYSAQDFRFTTRGGFLYAYFLSWPGDGKLLIHCLDSGDADNPPLLDQAIGDVSLLGSSETIAWVRGTNGLSVTLPATKPCKDVFGLKIALK
jgi:alpha-L-fucosidase